MSRTDDPRETHRGSDLAAMFQPPQSSPTPTEMAALGKIRELTLQRDKARQEAEIQEQINVQLVGKISEHIAERKVWQLAVAQVSAVVSSWPHRYVDEDTYFSCAQAVRPGEPESKPGDGCADDGRSGCACDCNLDDRRLAILGPLAAAIGVQP